MVVKRVIGSCGLSLTDISSVSRLDTLSADSYPIYSRPSIFCTRSSAQVWLTVENNFYTVGVSKKRGLRSKSKVCSLDTHIWYSGLRISHSKVFRSDKVDFLLLGCNMKTREATGSKSCGSDVA